MSNTGTDWRLTRQLLIAALIAAALYFGQDVFVPFALAALISLLLTPLVVRLEHLGLRRIPAVALVCGASLASSATVGWVVLNQFTDLTQHMPDYKENIRKKLQALKGPAGAAFAKAAKILRELGQPDALAPPAGEKALPQVGEAADVQPAPEEGAPRRVTVVQKESNLMDFLRDLAGPTLRALGKAAIVVILVVFILIGRGEIRDRLIRLAGTTRINLTTQALNDAGERVSRYLLIQFAINAAYGAAVGLGLYFIGIPNVLIWGFLAMVLRFIPYLGFWLAAAFPFIIALAAPTWFEPVATLMLFGTLELIANNLEPSLYGSSTGLSSIAVLGSALFWAWLWGAVGLILATPLTVVLVVLGRYVPHLSFLQVILGDEPVLKPHVRLYQRLLATDNEEAEDLFAEFRKGKSLAEAYDALALPALALAESDYHLDLLDEARRKFVYENMRELVREQGSQLELSAAEEAPTAAGPASAPPLASPGLEGIPVLCLPACDEADEIAGSMLAQLLEAEGVSMKTVSLTSLTGEMLEQIGQEGAQIICISAVPPASLRHARYLYKRIRARYPRIPIVVAWWCGKLTPDKAMRLIGCSADDSVAMTAAEAVKHLLRLVNLCFLRQQEEKKAQVRSRGAIPVLEASLCAANPTA